LGKIQRHLVLQRLHGELSEEERPAHTEIPAEAELAAQDDDVSRGVIAYLRETTKKPPSDWTTT